MSERRALELAGMSPSVLRYEPRDDGNAQLRAELVALAHRHRRHGYRMLYLRLCQRGWRVNIKRVRRLYREENLMASTIHVEAARIPDRDRLLRELAASGLEARAVDEVGIGALHLMGISYGGFVSLEFARLHHDRLHTLTLSGILLEPEELFEMYEALSLLFYRRGPEVFDIYTHYLYEKIFGEAFVRKVTREGLEPMRQRFVERRGAVGDDEARNLRVFGREPRNERPQFEPLSGSDCRAGDLAEGYGRDPGDERSLRK